MALNRAVAIAQRHGPQRGLEEISAIEDVRRLAKYPFYHAALAEFEFGIGQPEKAREHFANALSLARNEMERSFFEQRIISCK